MTNEISGSKLLLCYNRGCGKSFDPDDNGPESCRHHIGHPVFHDAYKGWSCCKKKCTDFTEFLNIKGCTVSRHSNEKPPELEKPKEDKKLLDEVIEYRAPQNEIIPEERPPFDSPMVVVNPNVSLALREQLTSLKSKVVESSTEYDGTGSIPVGTTCKNYNCNVVYEGPETLSTKCTHHPGCPVFHEGLKFWSCCTKRTTDFNTFLEQVGCTVGEHVWFEKTNVGEVKCRLDWHQTGSHIYVSIFGKKCDPESSIVELSPVRLKMSLFFPEKRGTYTTDIELRGVIDVENSSVSMLPTKIEVKLKKKGPRSWPKLGVEHPKVAGQQKVNADKTDCPEELEPEIDAVDLSCI